MYIRCLSLIKKIEHHKSQDLQSVRRRGPGNLWTNRAPKVSKLVTSLSLYNAPTVVQCYPDWETQHVEKLGSPVKNAGRPMQLFLIGSDAQVLVGQVG